MPKYTAIPHPKIQTDCSDLLELRWLPRPQGRNGIDADFIIPGDDANVLRVQFHSLEILRLVDEMPISTESEPTPNEGLIQYNFAYVVEGAAFWEQQSEALKLFRPGLKHYRFITGWTCMDVISREEPQFSIVPKRAQMDSK